MGSRLFLCMLICIVCGLFLPVRSAYAQFFSDISQQAGFTPTFLANIPAGGIAIEDFNRDGRPDIFVTGYLQPNRLYFNQGNGMFAESAAVSATIPGYKCSVVAAADYDNDGWPDLYMGCRDGPNYLLHNESGQGFINATPTELNHAAAGTNSPRTDAVAWGDLDGNGYLDIFIGIYPSSSTPDLGNPDNLDRIVLNNGDGTWTNIAADYTGSDRATLGRTALAVAISDLDMDGRPDIYVVNDKLQGNVLWHNDGAGCGGWCFSDSANITGALHPAFGMGISVADIDHDGDWDIYYSSIDEQFLLRGVDTDPLYFQRETGSVLNHFGVGWGTIFTDFDNDGWEDAFLAVGSGGFSTTPNADQLFRNVGAGDFVRISSQSGLSTLLPTQAAARLDFDGDGLVDLVLGHWNEGYRLYKNTGSHTNHWLELELRGGGAINRDAIGALVTVVTPDGVSQIRELRAGESRGSSHQPMLHFGLGSNTAVEVTILWPNGEIDSLNDLGVDQYHKIYFAQDLVFSNGFEQ